LRLACLIASGKNKYDIAAEMEIRVESVKQARWRLRQKISLSSDQDLDQLLIAIAQ
jgi:DNA-binding CsgD family transcriptional regulator